MEPIEKVRPPSAGGRSGPAALNEAERVLLGEALALFAEHNADVFDEPTAECAFILAGRLGVLDELRGAPTRKQELRAERAREAIAEIAELRERLDDITRGEASHD